ncbi:hypothetical protein ACRN9G_17615 [Shewanella frigidimarina]|uniref:hypothetical protein n=1 Tax=Shewanella frigidimarina TaxID=56812 RepID=UPI003D79E50F
MKNWVLDLRTDFMKSLYGSYLTRIDHITTLYSVVAFNEKQISLTPDILDDSFEVPLSNNFRKWVTIKNKRDIVSSVQTGELHQINCYQTIVSLVSNFEDLIDKIVYHFSVNKNEVSKAVPVSLSGEIDSPIIKKLHAVHSKLSMKSPILGKYETGYYYKIIKVRNCIIHRQGVPNCAELVLLKSWVSNGHIVFDHNQIDDFIHFFLMPLKSMIIQIDQYLLVKNDPAHS